MAHSVVIRDVVYADCESVDIPIQNSQEKATFTDTSDATLSDGSQMREGYTAYADGVKYTGSIPTKTAANLSASGATVTVPAGYYASQATKSVDSGSVTAPATITGTSASVSTGTNTLTLSKTVSVTPNVTAAGYIPSGGGTAGNSSVSLTASVTTKAAATLQPGTSAVTIAAGTYLTGVQTIPAEPNYLATNIVSGKSLWGLNGQAVVPNISYNSTTHVLSIS